MMQFMDNVDDSIKHGMLPYHHCSSDPKLQVIQLCGCHTSQKVTIFILNGKVANMPSAGSAV